MMKIKEDVLSRPETPGQEVGDGRFEIAGEIQCGLNIQVDDQAHC